MTGSTRGLEGDRLACLQAFSPVKEHQREGRIYFVVEASVDSRVDECTRDMPALELALLRRGVEYRDAAQQRCSRCRRTPLLGERIYMAVSGPVLCELCRVDEPAQVLQCRVVLGPTSGRAIRILDQRAA